MVDNNNDDDDDRRLSIGILEANNAEQYTHRSVSQHARDKKCKKTNCSVKHDK